MVSKQGDINTGFDFVTGVGGHFFPRIEIDTRFQSRCNNKWTALGCAGLGIRSAFIQVGFGSVGSGSVRFGWDKRVPDQIHGCFLFHTYYFITFLYFFLSIFQLTIFYFPLPTNLYLHLIFFFLFLNSYFLHHVE